MSSGGPAKQLQAVKFPRGQRTQRLGITGSACKSIYHPLLPGFQEARGWLLFETGSPMDSYIPGWPGTECLSKDDLELFVLLPPLPECWDYRHAAPDLIYRVGD